MARHVIEREDARKRAASGKKKWADMTPAERDAAMVALQSRLGDPLPPKKP